MNYERDIKDWKKLVREASAYSKSASEAAAKLGIKYDTYKKYAIKYGCFVKNQAGKGCNKNKPKIPLQDILTGKYPEYQSNKLRIRLLDEGVFEHRCNKCFNTEWLAKPIPLELEHKNGISSDHSIDNLELLCPNCHALTSTYRGKNKRARGETG